MKHFNILIALFLLSTSTTYSGPIEDGKKAYEKGDYRLAHTYFEKALASHLKTYGEHHPRVATDWKNLGEVCRKAGKYHKAIKYYELALASDLETYDDQHPKVAVLWNNLGLQWQRLGDHKKAIEYYEKALASDLKTYGDQHPNRIL